MYAVRYPTARASSQSVAVRWKVAQSASGGSPVHSMMHEVKVPEGSSASSSLPSAIRSGAASSRMGSSQSSAPRRAHRVRAQALGEDDDDVGPVSGRRERRQRIGGAQRDAHRRRVAVKGRHARCVHHAVQEARVGRRRLERARLDEVGAVAVEGEREADRGQDRERARDRGRRPADEREDGRRHGHAEDQRRRRPEGPREEPRADDGPEPDAEADRVAGDVRVERVVIEDLPAVGDDGEGQEDAAEEDPERGPRRRRPRDEEPAGDPERGRPEAGPGDRGEHVQRPHPPLEAREIGGPDEEIHRDGDQRGRVQREEEPRALAEEAEANAAEERRGCSHGAVCPALTPSGARCQAMEAGRTPETVPPP